MKLIVYKFCAENWFLLRLNANTQNPRDYHLLQNKKEKIEFDENLL